jgi:hypothetical protein
MRQDLRLAFRMLVKDRWFTLVAILALGLGIGLNATVFTFVNAVLIRGLPFPHPEQIFHINGRNTSTGGGSAVSFLDFEDYRTGATAFAGLAAYRGGNFTVTENGRPPERLQGVFVTANTFSLLGQAPMYGRAFSPDEDRPGAPPAALVGYGVWQSRYAGDGQLVGRVIKINGVSRTVIGIMPEGMKFPNNADIWLPLVPEADDQARRDERRLNLFGRLAPGATRPTRNRQLHGNTELLANH